MPYHPLSNDQMKIFIYFSYPFLLQLLSCPPNSLLINHIFYWERKLQHTGVDITRFFKDAKSSLTKHKKCFLEGFRKLSIMEWRLWQRLEGPAVILFASLWRMRTKIDMWFTPYKNPCSLICCWFNLLLLISHRGESRIPKATKMKIFGLASNDSQPLTVAVNNFVLDATSVLDPRDRL